MKSLRELLIKGPGPSSSHTIGPYRITLDFLSKLQGKEISFVTVTLYGSLALTGRGHFTDKIIIKALGTIPNKIVFDVKEKNLTHPNTMELKADLKEGSVFIKRYVSLGGGAFKEENGSYLPKDIYPFTTFNGLKKYLKDNKEDDIYKVIVRIEGEEIERYAEDLLLSSFRTLENSLLYRGYLPGKLHLKCSSGEIVKKAMNIKDEAERRNLLLTGFAYATSEANARGEEIVTAPTCGASGVVPSVLYYAYKYEGKSLSELVKAYLAGALVCNFIKENASVSGALSGCQAEIGPASSFAAASLAYLHHLSVHQIEYASEVAMEHFLGLTCDPVDGYVQIPCIERNGMATLHAYSAYLFAKDIAPLRRNRVSFDKVVEAMKSTGSELPSDLKETSLGGLAKVIS